MPLARYLLSAVLAGTLVLAAGCGLLDDDSDSDTDVVEPGRTPSDVVVTSSATEAATTPLSAEQVLQSWSAAGGRLAAWDPDQLLDVPTGVAVLYLDWSIEASLQVPALLDDAAEAGDAVLITWQPWVFDDGADSGLDLEEIAGGEYDDIIQRWTEAAAEHPQLSIFLRFAPQMDLSGTDAFPWADQDPELFIDAWEHVAERARDGGAGNVHMVWSPLGSPTALDYYPGDEWVDIVGLNVGVAAAWDTPDPTTGQYRSFEASLRGLLNLSASIDKPRVVTEASVDLRTADQEVEWIEDMLAYWQDAAVDLPLLVYINDRYPFAEPIDWRLGPDARELFEAALAAQDLS
ncbi:MAG: hypothetical protein GEU28_02160 [Dehalococcoidia bacterium]|nr:hypothetical protein [Dehalococcoidia bacterium]